MTLLSMLRFMEPPTPVTWSVKAWIAVTATVPPWTGRKPPTDYDTPELRVAGVRGVIRRTSQAELVDAPARVLIEEAAALAPRDR